MFSRRESDLKRDAVEGWTAEFVAGYPRRKKVATRWRRPLLAAASALDPLFTELKSYAHAGHLTPRQLLSHARTVLVYYVPFTETLHLENAGPESTCSRSWAVAYTETNQMLDELSVFLQKKLTRMGYRTALIPATHNFDRSTLLSNWSHRHAAYVAGLGRLGLHNLLITELGCTGRLGSLVTDCELEVTARPDTEFCLHKAGRRCEQCQAKCSFGAFSPRGFDRFACYAQCRVNDRHHEDLGRTEICGKCTASIPCSTVNPVKSSHPPVII
jgi:epoxyqueuosine reductase QueG